MLNVLFISNPFDIHRDQLDRHVVQANTVRGALLELWADFEEFEHPTICLVNSEPVLRADWDAPVQEGATVTFLRIAEGVAAIIIAVVVIVVAVAVAFVVQAQNPAAIGAADAPGQQQNGQTVYSLSGEQNQVRLNSPIECAYGRNRLFPSYAAAPYTTYDGNEQYEFSLYCLGHGSFTIEELRFEDTNIDSFDDLDYQIVQPGGSFTLFADNVATSSAVQGIELFGSNEEEYAGPTAAFTTNAPFTKTTRIEIDISLPAGLYTVDTHGKLKKQQIDAQWDYQRLNDVGAPIGPWTRLANFSEEMASNTPQRFTIGVNVPGGRYQVRGQRTNQKNTAVNSGNTLRWDTLRAFFPSTRNYGDVTLIAVKARASNNLNNNAAQRFNVIATRRLPIWNPVTKVWSAPTATRNPVWAFCDVFRSTYGGRLPDTFLDLGALSTLAGQLNALALNFDYIFDQKATVWEAARSIGRVARSMPMLNGSRITLVRDTPKAVASAVFNQHNIVEGSFTWSIKLRNVEDFDGLEMQYMDPETWIMETVVCLLPGDVGDQPEQVKLPGCANRTQAYQEGLYQRAVSAYCRENIEFRTGLEGFLPRYGDMIMVSHDVPRWGLSGMVLSIVGTVLTLNEPVEFTPGITHRIILRKKDGSSYGPVTCTPGADDFHVVVDPAITEPFNFDDIHERPLYLFGQASFETKKCVVVGLTPEADDTITIKAVNYDDRVFSFASAPTPVKYTQNSGLAEPSFPVVTNLSVAPSVNTNEFIQISWTPALGAKVYDLEQSVDGVNWTPVSTTPNVVYELRVDPGYLYLRVAGVNVGRGPWATWSGRVGDVLTRPVNVQNFRLVNIGPGYTDVAWDPQDDADRFEISMYDRTAGTQLRSVQVNGFTYRYTLDFGDIDGLTQPQVLFRAKAVNLQGKSPDAAVLTVTMLDRPVDQDPLTTDEPEPIADTTTIDHA